MAQTHWRKRIVVDPHVHHGDPCIKGTRVPVSVIVASIAEGDSVDDLIRSFPSITPADVRAALQYAAAAVNRFDYVALSGKD